MKFNKIRMIGRTTTDFNTVGLASVMDKYVFKGADGLGPTGFNLYISDRAVMGGTYQGRRPINRQLVFRIGLNPQIGSGLTPSDLREELYGHMMPGESDSILVQIMEGEEIKCYTEAWVEKIEIVPFAKVPEVQITMLCTEPYLFHPEEIDLVYDGGPSIGYIPVINNPGSAPCGVEVEVVFIADSPLFRIVNNLVLADATEVFYLNYAFLNGDRLYFNTNMGKRKIIRTRAGVDKNLAGAMDDDSIWPTLRPGANPWFLSPFGGFLWNQITYRPKYLGV